MKTKRIFRKIAFGMGIMVFLLILIKGRLDDEEQLEGLWRQKNGDGEYETALILEIDGTMHTEMVISVPEQTLSETAEKQHLESAIEEIEASFLGENESLDNIQNAIVTRTSYQDGKVLAEWKFSDARLFRADGSINESMMLGDEKEIVVTVYLTCENSSIIHEFGCVVHKRDVTKEEQFFEELRRKIAESGAEEGAEFLSLPTTLDGHSLEWKEKVSERPLQIIFLLLIIVAFFPALKKERANEQRKKRQTQLMQEYSGLVKKLALLMGAGMTLQRAWKYIVTKYNEDRAKRQRGICIVYEEMLITQREIESGRGELNAYAAFGERCELQKYRKLSSYLVQNLRKGNRQLCNLLEQEAEEAFAERKNMAQRIGEEMETKLLFPMLLMLGIVVVIIMIPAVISFRMGIN